MPHRLPDNTSRWWLLAGGVGLAGLAGYVNVLMLNLYHVPVSHITGPLSHLAIDMTTHKMVEFMQIAGIVAAFLVGAIISGAVIGDRHLKPGRRYGVVLIGEGLLLCASALLAVRANLWATSVAALACGLQNAMAASYHGLVIRTTHMTGVMTDLGIQLGHLLRGQRVHGWQLFFLLTLLLGFFGGGLVGAIAHTLLGMAALWVAAGGCLSTGMLYLAWRQAIYLRRRTAPH